MGVNLKIYIKNVYKEKTIIDTYWLERDISKQNKER